ncbi:MAG: hypothetical protein HFI70_01915 [Lachnospiraceae bacterium]|nr:hypothetical protein [Lachnospiraceae bacterium]
MKFLNCKECEELFAGKEVYVFGAGVDGESLYRKLGSIVTICAFIDNKRFGAGNYFCGKEIINLEQFKLIRTDNQPVLIASYRYMEEICRQMTAEGFVPDEDFFIWDDMCIHHADDITKQYINFMSGIWKNKKRENRQKIILVPFDSRHDQNSVQYAYCANYLAEKYDASIYGFCRYGASAQNASKVVLDIYKAFNVAGLVDSTLNEELQKESDAVFQELWENLYTWADWNQITVFDICFGTAIISDFLREELPDYNLRSERIRTFLKKSIDTIVFWYHFIQEHDIVTVLLADAVCWEAYIREIALAKGIPTYAIEYTMQKAYPQFHNRHDASLHFKEMWKQLTAKEQAYGISWAKDHIDRRINGNLEDISEFVAKHLKFESKSTRVLDDDDKMKIIICPHIFEENSYQFEQIFDNSYMSWLCHLGELSEQTPDYHWYLKPHPCGRRRDFIIMETFSRRYPKIKMLPSDISAVQLKKEGADFALTVCGTIGHEYPALGIQVINAGQNPHSAFDFTWNPRTKEEYDDLIMNLEKLEPKDNIDELYQFYSMHYLFYDWEYIPYKTMFYQNPLLPMCKEELSIYGRELGTWKYEEYMKEWTPQNHEKLWGEMEHLFQKMDEWRPDVFYRRPESMEQSD